MEIKLLKLSLVNFKGIREMVIDFGDVTNIYGQNASGKTSIFDAFTWLLFGKNSFDKKDFEIKTLDNQNQVIPKIEHEVCGEFEIDGRNVIIKRILREKWEKRKGGVEVFYNGNENVFFWNEVPMQAGQFQAKVNELLQEGTFKLITNALYFNSLPWEKRRAALIEIAGKIDDADVLNAIGTSENRQQVQALANAFKDRKTIEQYKAELAAKKKKLKTELDLIPARIDEVRRSIPEAVDVEAMETEIQLLQNRLNGIDEEMVNASRAQQAANQTLQEKQQKLHQHKTERQNVEFAVKNKFNEDKNIRANEIKDKTSKAALLSSNISLYEKEVEAARKNVKQYTQAQAEKRNEWLAENSKELVFEEGKFCCPACNTPFAPEKIESEKQRLTASFNSDKQRRLEEIKNAGSAYTEKIAAANKIIFEKEEEISAWQSEKISIEVDIANLKAEHERLNNDSSAEIERLLAESYEYTTINTIISGLEYELSRPQQPVDLTSYRERKAEITSEIDGLKKQLANKEARQKGLDRLQQLEGEQTTYAQQLADLEGYENAVMEFTRAKMDTLVSRINGRFKVVKFKMFDKLDNGGEVECCETLVPGPAGLVPFSDANNAARINAGLDIINTLCQHYNVYAPVFIDNAESVNTLLPVNSQLIRLVVSTDKQLRVESNSYANVTLFDRVLH